MKKRHGGKISTTSIISDLTYIIHFDLRCTNESSEFLPTTKEQNEKTIRDMVATMLYMLFTQISVDKVSIQWISKSHTFSCFQISVNAHCSRQTFADAEIEMIARMLESRTITVFSEFFASTHVDEFVVRSLPTKEWNEMLSQ